MLPPCPLEHLWLEVPWNVLSDALLKAIPDFRRVEFISFTFKAPSHWKARFMEAFRLNHSICGSDIDCDYFADDDYLRLEAIHQRNDQLHCVIQSEKRMLGSIMRRRTKRPKPRVRSCRLFSTVHAGSCRNGTSARGCRSRLRGGPSRTVQTIVRERATKRAGDHRRLVLAIGINPLQVKHLSTISLSIRLIDCSIGLFLC
jgi:hypothetical protein